MDVQETQKHLLSIREFAIRAGMSMSTVRRRIKDGSLQTLQLGGSGKQHRLSAEQLGDCEATRPGKSNLVDGQNTRPIPSPLVDGSECAQSLTPTQERKPRWKASAK